MKCTIPEISWHNRDPVLCIDVQSSKPGMLVSPYRLATGGTDSHVVIWYLTVKECGLASVEVAADLQRHQRAVNTVRFSPSGQFLASGDDESVIIVWKPKTEHDISDLTNTDGEVNKEQWVSVKILRGHLEDVYDLSWSPDSVHLISGSIDNTAIIWDIQKGRNLGILSGHGGFVQGVAWDPKNKYAATLSSDRTCRIHNISTKKLTAKVSKSTLPVPPGSELSGKSMRLYHDDTLKSFFRRLSFSPDGELLVTPSGVIEIPNTEKHINATYMFSRYDFSRPLVYLPSPHEYTVAVRFCPLLFKLREGSTLFALPYRMVFAVATKSNVILYDTQQPEPIALISNIHYTRLTDLSWSSDGRVLIASSTDGYCSIITFSEEELGEVYELSTVNMEGENEIQNPENLPQTVHDSCTSNGSSSSEKICEKEKNVVMEVNKIESKTCVTHIPVKHVHSENEVGKHAVQSATFPVVEKKSPRRIPLVTLSSPRKRLRDTTELCPKKSCETEQFKVTSTDLPDHDIHKCETQKHSNSSKNSSKERDCKEIGSSDSATVKVAIEDSVEHVHTLTVDSKYKENEDRIESEDVSCGSLVKPMEVDPPSITKAFHNETGGSLEADKAAANNCTNRTSISPASEDPSQQGTNENLNKTNFNTNDAGSKEDCSETEKCEKKSIKIDKNVHETETDVQNRKPEEEIPENCKKSPKKIPVANTCETTPLKLLHDDAEAVLIGTPRRASGEVFLQQEVSCNVTPVEKRTPRRVQFITISSPKSKKKLM